VCVYVRTDDVCVYVRTDDVRVRAH